MAVQDARDATPPATTAPGGAAAGLDAGGIGPFTSFALAMSTICIVAGGVTSFYIAFGSVGGAAIGFGWPLGCLGALAVALTMGQLASAFPRAGGPYLWASILGGRGWGWATACLGLIGLAAAIAAVNAGAFNFIAAAYARVGGYDPNELDGWLRCGVVILMTASQAFINHRGIRLTARLLDISGYLIVAMVVLLTLVLVVFGLTNGSGADFTRLWRFDNFGGRPEANPTWPATTDVAWLFALGLMLPAYTITGFDAPAQTIEETVDPGRNVPRAIVRGVMLSGATGWIMLSALVLAIPDMEEAAGKGNLMFFHVLRAIIPDEWRFVRTGLYIGLGASMYLCSLATLTSVSRMTWAFARDRGLPFSTALSRIGRHRTPSAAIWSAAGVVALLALPDYNVIAAVCAIFLYLAYVLPTFASLRAYDRLQEKLGPWHVGKWYRPLAVVSCAWCVLLFIIGVQPPNEIALWIVGGTILVLLALWFGYLRRRFPGLAQEAIPAAPSEEAPYPVCKQELRLDPEEA
ncbi:MAG: APC family permease [Gemmataceae bacterium]